MEPLLGDVTAAAAALCVVPPGRRGWVLARMMREAVSADAHRARFRRAHPIWGDGSLMAAAMRRPRGRMRLSAPDFRAALIEVIAALGEEVYPLAQPRHLGVAASSSSRARSISSPQSVQ